MEVTGYQDEDIGVLLRVTPVINNDNTVTLKIHPEVSEITGYTGPNDKRPIVSTREVTTSFTVENGKTVVLGGLMKRNIVQCLNDFNIPLYPPHTVTEMRAWSV
jgi:general secretion pathway protein D